MSEIPDRLQITNSADGFYHLNVNGGTEYVRADLALMKPRDLNDTYDKQMRDRIAALELSIDVRTAQRDLAEHRAEALEAENASLRTIGLIPQVNTSVSGIPQTMRKFEPNIAHDAFCTCAACVTPERLAADAQCEAEMNMLTEQRLARIALEKIAISIEEMVIKGRV